MHEFMPNDQQVENHIGVGPLYLNDLMELFRKQTDFN
jgi:hypothetical protein